jgi:DHA1 family tetracycline resistance protein-like MFS transporter
MAPGLASAALSLMTIVLTVIFVRESHPLRRKETLDEDDVAGDGGDGLDAVTEPAPLPSRMVVLRNPVARYLLIQWGFHTFSFFIYISSISLFAYLRLGLNPQQVGRVLAISGAVRVLLRFFVFVPLLRWLGDRRTSLLGLGLFVGTFLALGFVQNELQFGAVLCGVSFAAGCARGILNSFISLSVGPLEQGRAMGLSASLDSLAQIAGPLIGGLVLDALPLWVYGGLASAFAMTAFVMGFRHYEFLHGTGRD